jgi:hypothetical protein
MNFTAKIYLRTWIPVYAADYAEPDESMVDLTLRRRAAKQIAEALAQDIQPSARPSNGTIWTAIYTSTRRGRGRR